MYPENIVLVRFDYVLGHDTGEVVNNFSGILGEVDSSMTITGIRGDTRTNEIYYTDDLDRMSELGYPCFKSLAVRIAEPTDVVTEIVSIVQIRDQLVNDVKNDNGRISSEIEGWKNNLENRIREYIPGNQAGSETTIILLKPSQLPKSLSNDLDNIAKIEMDFSDGVASRFIQECGASSSRGIITLNKQIALFLTNVQKQPYGKLIGIDISGVTSSPHGRGLQIPGVLSGISTLLCVHYWCAVRGKSLDEFDNRVEQSKEKLPSSHETTGEVISQLDLEQDLYQIQQDWGVTRSEITKEHAQLKRLIENWDPEYKATFLRLSSNKDILSQYHHELRRKFDNVKSDSQRIHQSISSISEFTDNQLSVAATRENIDLQSRVSSLTRLILFFTVVLVLDAFVPGGISVITEFISNWLGRVFDFYERWLL